MEMVDKSPYQGINGNISTLKKQQGCGYYFTFLVNESMILLFCENEKTILLKAGHRYFGIPYNRLHFELKFNIDIEVQMSSRLK